MSWRPAPRIILAVGVVGLFLAAVVTAWTAALARLPEQRAMLERLLQSQSGLDVRYSRLVVRLGFYGPEAQLSGVEVRRAGEAEPLLLAPRVVLRFESWRLLRGGELRPGRILVSEARINLRQVLEPAPRAPATSIVREMGWEQSLSALIGRLAAGLPSGSLELEGATLDWSRGPRDPDPISIRAPSLFASRRADGLQVSSTLLLPARLGRTLFIAASLQTPRPGAAGESGTIRVSGRDLILAGWRNWLGAGLPVLAGAGELRLQARLRNGALQQGEIEADLREVTFEGRPAVALPPYARVQGVVTLARRADGIEYRARNLLLQPRPLGAAGVGAIELISATVFASTQRDMGWIEAPRVPLAVLGALLPWVRDASVARLPLDLIVGGEIRDLRLNWSTLAATGPARALLRLGYTAAVAELRLAPPDGSWAIGPVDGVLVGRARTLTLRIADADTQVQMPLLGLAAQQARLAGTVELVDRVHNWSLSTDDLRAQLASGVQIDLRAALGGTVGTAATRWTLQASLPLPLPAPQWDLFAAGMPHGALGTVLSARRTGRIEGLRFALAGATAAAGAAFVADYVQGEARLRAAGFAAEAALPAIDGLDADISWTRDGIAAQLLRGSAGGLRLRSGRLSRPSSLAVRGAPSPSWSLEAVVDARARDLGSLTVVDPILQRALAGLDGRTTVDLRALIAADALQVQSWRASLQLREGTWRPAAELPAFEGIAGTAEIDDQQVRRARFTGSWLDGPFEIRVAPTGAGLALSATGGADAAAVERQWGARLASARVDRLPWRIDVRPVRSVTRATARRRGDAPRSPDEWQLRARLADRARLELFWLADGDGGWRVDRGTIKVGEGGDVAHVPGAMVVGGRIDTLDLNRVLQVAARDVAHRGWQPPLVGEVAVTALRVGRIALGDARLRLEGSRETTRVLLDGPLLSGEIRQLHATPGQLQAQFSRLRILEPADLAAWPAELMHGPLRLSIGAARLAVGTHELGRFNAELKLRNDGLDITHATLGREAASLDSSGSCSRATQRCQLRVTGRAATLEPWAAALGLAAAVEANQLDATATLDWTTRGDGSAKATMLAQVQIEAARLALLPAQWPAASGFGPMLLGPTLAAVSADWRSGRRSSAPSLDTVAELPRVLELGRWSAQIDIANGVARLERWSLDRQDRSLRISGSFDLATATVAQRVMLTRQPSDVLADTRSGAAQAAISAAWSALRRFGPAGTPVWPADTQYLLSGPASHPDIRVAMP